MSGSTALPLAGLKVLELGQLIAGPFAGKMLADFGADVIKVEPPGSGDPLRKWRMLKNGTSVWWQVQSRNKRSIALDLRTTEGQGLCRRLAVEADVIIENFKPGTLEGWGLGHDELSRDNPGLVMLRISGYGQDGPYADRPGFGVIAEAMGGLRHLSGEPGRLPVRVGVSIGDTLAALHGVIGVLLALLHRRSPDGEGKGQVVDVALYEAVFNCMESLLPEYSAFGAVREPAGSALPGIAPSNAYRCADGAVLIGGNGDSIYRRLMDLIGRPDLRDAADLASNDGRARRAEELDAAIGAWTASRPLSAVLEGLNRARVPAGRIYTAKDIAEDPHYRARGMIRRITTAEGYELDVPGVVPKLSATPGRLSTLAPGLGSHTAEVLREMGISEAAIAELAAKKVIATDGEAA